MYHKQEFENAMRDDIVFNIYIYFYFVYLQAMVLFAGPQRFSTELFSIFHDLVQDPHALVRRTVACGFHEVCSIHCL